MIFAGHEDPCESRFVTVTTFLLLLFSRVASCHLYWTEFKCVVCAAPCTYVCPYTSTSLRAYISCVLYVVRVCVNVEYSISMVGRSRSPSVSC